MEAINIYPEPRNWKVNKKGIIALTIRFDYNNQRAANQPLHQTIKIDDWDKKNRVVKNSAPNANLINQLIENTINKHQNYFLRRQLFELPISFDLVRKYAKSETALESFYEYADQVLKTKKLGDGRGYSEDTVRRYNDEIKRMMVYQSVLHFKDITIKFLDSYKVWLQTEYKKKDGKLLDKNSVWKALGFVRMVYKQAIKDELISRDNNPFLKFNVGSYEENTEKIKWLELEDVNEIENVLKTKSKSLDKLTIAIGWRFLAMCVSGMRISDAMYLDDMFFNDAGDLEFKPYKTRRHNNKAQIPITSDRQKQYLQRSLLYELPATSHKSFRTTFNTHLKILAAVADIKINLTSHVGRHTMGSFLVDADVQDKAAKAMLGVKKDNVLRTYQHLKKNKLRSEAEKLNKVF